MFNYKKIVLTLILITSLTTGFAQQTPRSVSADYRVKFVPYNQDNVTILKLNFGYETEILFEKGEQIIKIAIGDRSAWKVKHLAHYLFIAPQAPSNTNMTVITNKRDYNFQLETNNEYKNTLQTFRLQFIYPEKEDFTGDFTWIPCQGSDSELCNWQYSYTGNQNLAPIEAFDDGKFTFFKFRSDGRASIPAVYTVDPKRNETLVNYHMAGDYLIVNQVSNQYTFRNGNEVTSIYNDQAIGDWPSVKKPRS